MKVLITNTVTLNTGDAAILEGMMHTFRHRYGEGVEFVVHDSDPTVSQRYYPHINFRPLAYDVVTAKSTLPNNRYYRYAVRALRNRLQPTRFQMGLGQYTSSRQTTRMLRRREQELLKSYKDADLVVSTGGTYLVPEYSIESRLLEFRIAHALNRELILYTQSVGYFSERRLAVRLAENINEASLVLLRDEESRKNLKRMGCHNKNTSVTSDAAFALADKEKIRNSSKRPGNSKSPSIAISVRDWGHFSKVPSDIGMANYGKAVAETVTKLVRRSNAQVTFLSTCQGISEYRFDDSRVAQSIHSLLPIDVKNRVAIVREHLAPSALMDAYHKFDLVIATRMHAAILALNQGVPVIPIAYEFKTHELFARLGLQAITSDIESVTGGELLASTYDVLNEGYPGEAWDEVLNENHRALTALDSFVPRSVAK